MSHALVNRYCSTVSSLIVVGALALPCSAEQSSDPGGFIEVTWMKVKQDRVSEFDQMARRIADANRRAKGDNWVAYTDFYGTDQYVQMASTRSSPEAIEAGMNKFMMSAKEIMGYTPDRFFAEAAKLVETSGTELRRRRWDLSWGSTDGQDWFSKMAKAAYVASVVIKVKPGRAADAEKQMLMLKQAATNKGEGSAGMMSQVVLGGAAGTFYLTVPIESLRDIAAIQSPSSMLGEEAYRNYLQMAAENYASVEIRLRRSVPAWSNPPASYLAANPKLWTVKAAPAPKPKEAVSENNPPVATK
jgi:hypothetical protein